MSRVIAELDAHTNHILVHTGQNYDYELNEIFFTELSIRKPDHFLAAVGDTVAQTIGRVIEKSDIVMEQEKPDAIMLYGDTNSCLSVIAAKRRKIPVFHMEAGNRCFDQRVPEELNRKVVDHLSDVNLVLTEHARRYLIAEGLSPETVIKTGSHMDEVLAYYKPKIEASDALERLALDPQKYFLVSAHREENVDDVSNLQDLLDTLSGLAEKHDVPVIVSTHPRTQKRMASLNIGDLDSRVRFLKPFGLFDYIKLQMEARCVISDSGTVTEESALLGFPAITIRNAHERPEGMDAGTLIMSGLKRERVLDAVEVVLAQTAGGKRPTDAISDYESQNVSKKIVRIVLSYTDYIDRTVWSKRDT
jgi:UDP-N-acetylglucosamine 2-epimerase (non-hydrolysing)